MTIQVPMNSTSRKAHLRTLLELAEVLARHLRATEHGLRTAAAVVEHCPVIGAQAIPRVVEIDSRWTSGRQIINSAVGRISTSGPIYGIPRKNSVPTIDSLDQPFSTAAFDGLVADDPLIVFGHPPIISTAGRYLRILGFHVHGMDRRSAMPCASRTPRSDLGLLLICTGLEATTLRSELVPLILPRTFPLVTVDQAVRSTVDRWGVDAELVTVSMRTAVGVLLANGHAFPRHEPLCDDARR